MTGMDACKLGMLLCLYTGLRVGEVCALRWRDFSPGFDVLTVRRTLQRVKSADGGARKTNIVIGEPKSRLSARDIPVPGFLVPHLRGFAAEALAYFLGSAERPFTEPRTMQNRFARCVKAAGIARANYHCLRHTFATRCVEAGVDVKSLSEMLGHSGVGITLNLYVHSSLDRKRECMSKLERYTGI
jgi:integrase